MTLKQEYNRARDAAHLLRPWFIVIERHHGVAVPQAGRAEYLGAALEQREAARAFRKAEQLARKLGMSHKRGLARFKLACAAKYHNGLADHYETMADNTRGDGTCRTDGTRR